MLLIVASDPDPAAPRLAARWDGIAQRVTLRDLSSPGWSFDPCRPAEGTIVAGGERVPMRDVTGVVSRLATVRAEELAHIVPEDRAYAAAEMAAFLLAWLALAPCPVLNRPTPEALCGGLWRRERWLALAARTGLDVAPISRRVGPGEAVSYIQREVPTHAVIVVGEECGGAPEAHLRRGARALARAAGIGMLVAYFAQRGDKAVFCGASPWPEVDDPWVADAMLDFFASKTHETRAGGAR